MNPTIQKLLRPAILIKAILGLVILIALVFGAIHLAGTPSKASDDGMAASDETWTCSMHPQIRQPNFGLCPICNMDLIPLETGSGGGLREVSVSPEAAALLDLRVTPVRRAPATTELRLFGRLAYDERKITSITARMDGRLDRLFVDFTGARVRKGDHLAEIYSPSLVVAQKELIEARRAFDSGSTSAGARDLRRRLLDAAREKLRLLQLSAEQIKSIETQAQPDPTLRIDSPQDGVVVDKNVSEGDYVTTGDPLLRVADLSSLWLQVEAYESDLPWLRYGQDAEFSVDSVPGEIFHGRVSFINPSLEPTRRIAAVRINVSNPDGRLKPGAYAKVRIASRMTANGKVIDPSLAGKWISPMHPEIVKDGPGVCDICGMDLVPAKELGFVDEDHTQPDPLLVPRSAVLQTGNRALVYVRLPEEATPVFEGRQIILGPAVGASELIVREGLSEGELVVTRGAFKIDSELQIKGKPSMMNSSAGLEERPADQAATDLLGQWPPIQRALHRFQLALQSGDPAAMTRELQVIQNSIRTVRTDAMQAENLALWQEFSNRLLTDLTLAADKLPNDPSIAAGIVTRSLQEAGRHLGLPYHPLETPPSDPALVNNLQAAIESYLPVADTLAQDDDPGSKAAAEKLATAIATLTLPDIDTLKQLAQTLAAATDIKARRAAFLPVSNALIALTRAHGIDQLGSLYVVHCPMAFKGDGGDWLSRQPTVLNPYYGSAMLTCGNLTDTLSVPTTPIENAPEKPELLTPSEDNKP